MVPFLANRGLYALFVVTNVLVAPSCASGSAKSTQVDSTQEPPQQPMFKRPIECSHELELCAGAAQQMAEAGGAQEQPDAERAE